MQILFALVLCLFAFSSQAQPLDPDWDGCRGYGWTWDVRWDLIDVAPGARLGLSTSYLGSSTFFGSGAWHALVQPADILRARIFVRACKNVPIDQTLSRYGGVQRGALTWYQALVRLQAFTPTPDTISYVTRGPGPTGSVTSQESIVWDFRPRGGLTAGDVIDFGTSLFRVISTNTDPWGFAQQKEAVRIGWFEDNSAGRLFVSPQNRVLGISDAAAILPEGEFPLPGGLGSTPDPTRCR